MEVDIASIKGGEIPIDPLSFKWPLRTEYDKRFKKDTKAIKKRLNSLKIEDIEISKYDIIFMSGGWGASYDFVQSKELAQKISQAYSNQKIMGSVCHGALGFIGATKPDGSALVKGVKMTGVTNKQVKELGGNITPKHPEEELLKGGADYSCSTGKRKDFYSNLVVVDEQHRIITGQNQKGGVETAQKLMLMLLNEKK